MLDRWRDELKNHSEPVDVKRFVEHVNVDYLPHTVIVDCSAIGHGRIAIAMAGGRHPCGDAEQEGQQRRLGFYDSLREARRASGAHYLYEATVGAGLPVIQTLRDLRETGDDITSIEGIFSGTLAYLVQCL